jgi:hypothetical protein
VFCRNCTESRDRLMVCLGIEKNLDSSLFFSTFFKNKTYFIQLLQIFLNFISQSQTSKFVQ